MGEEDDGDYSPSEVDTDSDDSLEWASETERTMAEDALAEGTVGLDFYGAAVSVATGDSSSSIINTINSVLSYLGFHLVSDVEDSSKPHLESGTEPFTPEQEFGEMTLSDYDSDEDADYEPSDSEGSEDELEYNSDASDISEGEPEEEVSGETAI